MSQSPSRQDAAKTSTPRHVRTNARVGLGLFFVYLAIYGGFVGLSAFAPGLMSQSPLGGLNVAILYGMGLIGSAFVLALVYMALCRRDPEKGQSR